MPGFMLKVSTNARSGYLAGAILFLLGGIALAIGGLVSLGTTWGVTGLVVAIASVVFLIDAIMNLS
jgi:hypothetical protein